MNKSWYIASGYGNGQDQDVVIFSMEENGKLTIEKSYTFATSPSYVCVNGKDIFIASENEKNAMFYWVNIKQGSLELKKQINFSGKGLCHLIFDGSLVYAQCYGSGEMYAVDILTGKIEYCYKGVEVSRMHWGTFVDKNRLYVTDLGNDEILEFYVDERKIQIKKCYPMPKMSGPRQLLCDEKKYILINEKNGTVAFSKNTDIAGKWIIHECTSEYEKENYPGGACLNSNGELFVGNRGANTIVVFAKEEPYGKIGEWECKGSWPRYLHFVKENYLLVAFQKSNEICSFYWSDNELKFLDSIPLTGASCIAELRPDDMEKPEYEK